MRGGGKGAQTGCVIAGKCRSLPSGLDSEQRRLLLGRGGVKRDDSQPCQAFDVRQFLFSGRPGDGAIDLFGSQQPAFVRIQISQFDPRAENMPVTGGKPGFESRHRIECARMIGSISAQMLCDLRVGALEVGNCSGKLRCISLISSPGGEQRVAGMEIVTSDELSLGMDNARRDFLIGRAMARDAGGERAFGVLKPFGRYDDVDFGRFSGLLLSTRRSVQRRGQNEWNKQHPHGGHALGRLFRLRGDLGSVHRKIDHLDVRLRPPLGDAAAGIILIPRGQRVALYTEDAG